jgi:co-chaperonin GroES (HSP10)
MDNATVKKIHKLERQLSKICQEIYELSMGGRHFIPRHPYVVVRVLPKEHKTEGGIFIPEVSQNKPVYEGIVLDTWKAYTELRYSECTKCTEEFATTINHKCELSIGDRIAFPHYEGMPMGDILDDKYYKLVREGTDQNNFPYCNVLGKLDYTGDVEVQAKIRALTKELTSVTFSGVSLSRGANIQTPNRA